jgi:hypothetical protein
MSFFVSVTFDLNSAKPSDYTMVKNKLEQIDLTKFISGKRKEVQLPNNTFASEFEGDDFDRSVELRNYIENKLRQIFKSQGLAGKFFIFVGKKWAWKVGNVT